MGFRLTPYLLRLLPSPEGDRVAMTVAGRDQSRAVSVLVHFPGSGYEEVTSFDTLLPTSMAWDAAGQVLACAQGGACRILDERGLTRHPLPGTAGSLGFDALGALWVLSDQAVLCGSPAAGFPLQRRWAGVITLAVGEEALCVRRRAGIAEIVVAEAEADRVLPWPLSCDTKARIAADPDGRGLLVSAEADAGPGLAQLELAWIDRATGQPLRVHRWTVRAEVGAPPITWSVFTSPAPKPTGRRAGAVVLCAREREKRLWHLDLATGEAVPLSPPAFDVSEFAVSRQSAQVAMIATSAGSDESRQNLLMLCRHTPGTAAVPRVLHRGASRVPVWAAKRSRLFHSDGGESADPTVCVHDAAGEPRSARGHEPCSPARMFATLTQKDGVETVALQRRAAKPGRSAIVYAQGPNRRLVDGRQPVFFHEALLSLLDDFARRGCRVVGVGKALTATDKDDGTEPAWLDAMRAALESSIQMLSESGIERIAVVGGSLGALPLLHALAGRQLAGAVLVSPVYSPRLPALRGWGHLFGAAGDVAAGELGARMQTPVLVVHGVSDELTPVAHSSSFVARVPEAVVCDYLTFPEEPHIFRRPETWSLALGKAQQFLSQHLGEALAG